MYLVFETVGTAVDVVVVEVVVFEVAFAVGFVGLVEGELLARGCSRMAGQHPLVKY